MTSPLHHPTEEDLLAYSAGTASEGVAVLVACHLTYCPICRDTVAFMDQVGGALVPPAGPAEPTELPSFEALLARLDSAPVPEVLPPPAPDEIVPAPLRARVGGMADLPWRSLPMGVRHAAIDLGAGTSAFLYDFPPGLRLPAHHHEGGVERAMPLTGGFTDEVSSYGPGDISVKGSEHTHRVRIDDDGRCVCLFVNDGLVVPDNLALRLLARWSGLGGG